MVWLALVITAALWLGDLYNASKFRFYYPKLSPGLLPRGAAKWKQVWVYRNETFKHAGLVIIWAGVLLGKHFADVSEPAGSLVFYAVGLLGFALYPGSRLWPALVEKPRRKG